MNFIKIALFSELPPQSTKIVQVKNSKVVLFHFNGKITALGNACLHKGGPLGLGCVEDKYDGTYITCPWHGWEYNIETGKAPLDYKDQQSVYEIKIEGDTILISDEPVVNARKATHDLSALDDLVHLKYQTTATSLNILGISTTNMNNNLPRFSTSENALERALDYASKTYGAKTKILKLRELKFRHCEGYYSQHMNACTWPCSVTEMDPKDGMTQVYRDMVLWADVILLATPIRWGNASSLYYKMVERLNTVQNQITLKKKILIKNKVAAFIITGGQDNIQSVAGQLMWFFTDLGFIFPPFSFIGWSRGWTAEDMDKNVMQFKQSNYIKRTTEEMVDNCIETIAHIKNMDAVKIIAPKPHRQDSFSADLDNPDMNI